MDRTDETLATEPVIAGEASSEPAPERFVMGAELGRGGMGRVVAATDRSLDRQVAIKQALSTNPTDLARFEREARITARLEHPSIVPIHEAGHDAQGRPYYVMRQIQGRALSEVIASTPEIRQRLALVGNVLAVVDAAAFAHARRVIHRDIKPLNILVGDYGETLLIDWGLARELDGTDETGPGATLDSPEPLTVAGQAFGTPGYMAPEQARGERVDTRADVYQLGATLFHVLAGVAPFDGIARSEWLTRAILGAPPPLERIGPEVPIELIAIVAKAMQLEAGERYRDAGELATDLRRFLAGQLVAAHRYTAAQRLARFIRRHRIAVAVTCVTFVAIVAFTSFALLRIVRERDRANEGQDLAADRAERLLLDRANTLVAVDPTRAAALLLQLPDGSRNWPRARDIAAAAAAQGLAHGIVTHHGPINELELSPGGRLLLTVSNDVIQVHDLAAATTRTFPQPGVSQAHWLPSGDEIVFGDSRALQMLDARTGQTHVVAHEGTVFRLWVIDGARVRYCESAHHMMWELAVAGGEPVALARDVWSCAGTGETAVLDGGGRLRALVGTHEVMLCEHEAHANADTNRQLAVSPDGARIAAFLDGSIVEWDATSGHERQHLDATLVAGVSYGADHLEAAIADPTHRLVWIINGRPVQIRAGDWSATFSTLAAHGTATAGMDGTITFSDRTGPHPIPFGREGTRHIVGRPDTTIIATGSGDGLVSWWDLRTVAPKPFELESGSKLCELDDENFYVIDPELHLIAIDRQTGKIRTIGSELVMRCGTRVGHFLVADVLPGARHVLDLRTGKAEVIDNPAFDYERASLLYVASDRRTVREIGPDDVVRTRWTASSNIRFLNGAASKIAVLLDDRHVVRITPEGEATTLGFPEGLEQILSSADGAVWGATRREIWRWTSGEPVLAAKMPLEIGFISEGDGALAVALSDQSLWFVSSAGVMNRADVGSSSNTFGRDVAVLTNSHGFLLLYLKTGVQVTRTTPTIASIVLENRDRSLAIAYPERFVLYEDPVPADPAEVRAWISHATNGRVSPTTDALSWE